MRVPLAVTPSLGLVALLGACQLVGDVGGKVLVTEDAGTHPADATAGDENPPLPTDCSESDPLHDVASWPVPPDGPDGTNYVVDDAAGTVLDKTTKLMWLAATSPKAAWNEAKCACRDVTAGGFMTWRMPSTVELLTIVDYAKNVDPTGSGTTVAATNTTVFPDTRLDFYWSATPQRSVGSPSDGMPYLVDFARGNTADATVTSTGSAFRCVRTDGPRPVGSRFAANAETVVDGYTSLEWERYVSSVELRPDAASGYCSSLNLHGSARWKLPTVKQLATLLDPGRYPTIDARTFPGTPPLGFATATRSGADPTSIAWTVSFGGLAIYRSPASVERHVRCVRAL